MKALGRKIRLLVSRLIRFIGKASGTPHQIALGVAVGFFIAWLPIVGIQMVVAVALCTVLKCNRVVPLFPIWLTNPATIIPVFSFNYWVGRLLVGGPPIREITGTLRKMIPRAPPEDMGWLEGWWTSFKEGFGELMALGWDAQLPLWLGCVVVGTALAVPSYYITRRGVVAFREALHQKRERRGLRLRQRLRDWRERRRSERLRRTISGRLVSDTRPEPPAPPPAEAPPPPAPLDDTVDWPEPGA